MRNFKTLLRMTASERAMGHFMRAPDHTSAESGGAPAAKADEAEPSSGADQSTEEQLTTEQALEKEFIQHEDEDGEDAPDDDDDGEDSGEDSAEDDDDEFEGDEEEGGDADESEEAEGEGDDNGEPSDKQSEADPELVRRAEEAEREAARLRKLAEDKGIDLDASNEVELPEEPDPDKYTYGEHDEQYIKDLAKYEAKMEVLAEQAETRFKASAATLDAKWAKNLAANKTRYADFDEVVVKGAKDGTWDASPVVAVAIKDSDHGVDIAYRLASNPEEAKRISALSPLEQARELGRMEAGIEHEKAAEQRKAERTEQRREARRVSNAPKPPKRKIRGGGGTRSATSADTDDFAAFDKMAQEKLDKAAQGFGY